MASQSYVDWPTQSPDVNPFKHLFSLSVYEEEASEKTYIT